MSIYRVDARGLSCPQPVVMVDRALREGKTELEVLVDNEVSKENVLRLITKKGLRAEMSKGEDSIVIKVSR